MGMWSARAYLRAHFGVEYEWLNDADKRVLEAWAYREREATCGPDSFDWD